MMLDAQQIAGSTGAPLARALAWVDPINAACQTFGIDNPERLACFLSQIGHESGSLLYTRELWGPTPAQARYEGRLDLGNTQFGDGFRFRGAGLIQITGRFNFSAVRDGLREALPDVPDFEAGASTLGAPQWAAMSAAWYFAGHGCNELADALDFETITRRINGGLTGEAQRVALWAEACAQLGAGGGAVA